MYNIDPHTYLWLHEQDREREQTQRALERAVQTGERRPGLVRAGFSSITRLVRGASAGARTAGFRGAGHQVRPTGTSAA